jgi:AhpD family alkylhydroperoxidase
MNLTMDPPALPHRDEPSGPRLAPIDRPKGLLVRLAYWVSKRRLGKVMTPARVVYARVPALFRLGYVQARIAEHGLSLDLELRYLVSRYVAALNGCSFCVDIARAIALQHHVPVARDEALFDFRRSPRFTPRERAALAYVDEATRHRRVSDATFEALRAHFSEREIVEITWLCALEHYYNLINLSLGIGSDDLCALAARPPRDA